MVKDEHAEAAFPVESRRALYYPAIEPRNVEWVKGTLLAFGQINRIVPDGYPLADPPELQFLRDFAGSDGEPLLRAISPCAMTIEDAQRRLLDAIQPHDPAKLEGRFGRRTTESSPNSPIPSEIFEEKFNYQLFDWLRRGQLIWPSPTHRGGQWWGIHPALGGAIMSVSAIAAARMEGLDIVTESVPLHRALAALDEREVLERLITEHTAEASVVSAAQVVDQLVHVVMTTAFDLSALSVKDVADLVHDGHDLRALKGAVARMAASVPHDASPARREKILKEHADGVIAAWKGYTRSVPQRLRDSIRRTGAEETESLLKKAGTRVAAAVLTGGVAQLLAASALHTAVLGAAAGLAVGVIYDATKTALRTSDPGPYRYLSSIEKAGATLLVVPSSYRSAS